MLEFYAPSPILRYELLLSKSATNQQHEVSLPRLTWTLSLNRVNSRPRLRGISTNAIRRKVAFVVWNRHHDINPCVEMKFCQKRRGCNCSTILGYRVNVLWITMKSGPSLAPAPLCLFWDPLQHQHTRRNLDEGKSRRRNWVTSADCLPSTQRCFRRRIDILYTHVCSDISIHLPQSRILTSIVLNICFQLCHFRSFFPSSAVLQLKRKLSNHINLHRQMPQTKLS